MKIRYFSLLLLFLFNSCSNNSIDDYITNEIKEMKNKDKNSIASSKNFYIKKDDINQLLMSSDTNIFSKQNKIVKKNILKRQLLMLETIEAGIEKDIYSSPQAKKFILPRLLKILEDYYYYNQIDYETIKKKNQKIYLNEKKMNEFLAQQKKGSKINQNNFQSALNKKIETLSRGEFLYKKKELMSHIEKTSRINIDLNKE